MKYLLSLFFVLLFSYVAAAQTIRLKGTLYDPTGAVVVGAEALAVSATNQRIITKSTADGSYLLELTPGRYRLEFHAPGFRRTIWNDYMVVKATFGAMNFDVVLLGQDGHEPCGYGGHCMEIPITKTDDIIVTERPLSRPDNTTIKKPRNQHDK